MTQNDDRDGIPGTKGSLPVPAEEPEDQELARLMAGLPGMVYRASAQAPFVFEVVGGGYEHLLGRTARDLVGNPKVLAETIHSDDLLRCVDAISVAVQRGEPFQMRYRMLHANGTMRVVWEQGRPVTMKDGRLVIEGTIVDIDEPVHARQLQDATYHISQAAVAAENLDQLYARIHAIVGELMPAQNLYIALRHPHTNIITYPYYFDEYDAPPDPQTAETGLTAHILRTGVPLLLSRFAEEGPIKTRRLVATGTPPLSWLGVPLKLKGRPVGVLAVQVYHGTYRYTKRDRDILSFVGDQIAVTIERQRAAAAIHASELRYRSLFEDAPVALWEEDFYDLDQRLRQVLPSETTSIAAWLHAHPDVVRELASLVRVVDVNRAAVRLVEASSKNQLLGSLMATISEEALVLFEDEVVHIAAGDSSFVWEGPVVTMTGKPLVVSFQLIVAPGGEENLHRVLIAMVDVTDRVVAEHALRDSEARMRALFAAMNDLIIVLDRDGRYIEIAPTREELLAAPREELLGRTVRELFDRNLAERFVQSIHRALESRTTTETDYSLETDGTTHWFEARISPLPDDRVLLVAHDATARHLAQEAAREEASKAETYFNMSGVIIEVYDANLHLVRLNQMGCDFFGYTPEEIAGQDWLSLRLPKRERDKAKAFLRGELEGQPIAGHINGPVVLRSGEERIISWHDSLLRDADGRVIGLISSGLDITHTVRLEEELQRMDKLESLGTLAGGIAHDFNNMLTGIIGNINLARMEGDRDRSRELLEEAEHEILRARGLSQQLLTFAKGGAPVRSVQDVGHLLRDAVSFALRGSSVSVQFDLPEDLWTANVDAGQISQVFSNLAINANEAMPSGGTVTVSARNVNVAEGSHADLAPGPYLQIEFRDSGIGIGPDDLPKIFDPFFSTKRRGSGLGLATSYAIIHKHDGHIGVTSTPGAGTTFTILLPAASAPASRSPAQSSPVISAHGRVLVMDDEPAVRQVVVAMLKKMGCDAEAVPDGAAALRADAEATASDQPFSVIIMDLTIPGGMGGEEAAALLRARGTPARLIASSGYATDPVMAEYRSYHFDAVLAKPFNFAELTSVFASLGDGPSAE